MFLSESDDVVAPTRRKRKTIGYYEEDLSVLPRIPNPVACLSIGDMLIFHLTINHTDRSLSHFPVYEKDHLFNSNPSWDFGVFRRVQALIKQSNLNNTWFVHPFSETGKYVFMDSAVPDWSLVVVVSEDGTVCDPRASVFQAMTPAQLVRYGVINHHRLNLLPDWGAISGLLSLILMVVVVVTTTVVVLWPSKEKLFSQWRTKPKWRSLGDSPRPMECPCSRDSFCGSPGSRSVGEGAEAEEPAISKGGIALACCYLEEFNVKTLYDKLEDQNLHVASQLARHRKDTQEFYRNISQQVDGLQNVFENMDGKKLNLLKQQLASQNAMRDKLYNSTVKKIKDEAEESPALLEAVLRSVEALLCKMNQVTWQTQDQHSVSDVHTQPPDAKERELQAQTSNNVTLDASMDLTQTEVLGHDARYNAQSFMQALHDAISALSLLLFRMSFKQSTAEGALREEFISIRVPKGVHFAEHLLDARLEKYKHSMLEQLFENLTPSTAEETETVALFKVSCVEEEIDRMNEAFLELSMQLQKRAHVSVLEQEGDDQSVRAVAPSLSRNGTILLEMKRRYVAQRLSELQITLERIGQRQGSRSGAGMHMCSSTAQQELAESCAGTDHL